MYIDINHFFRQKASFFEFLISNLKNMSFSKITTCTRTRQKILICLCILEVKIYVFWITLEKELFDLSQRPPSAAIFKI